ncbi:MAG: hypothetical protein OEY14_09740, partial [Myxococcales bacterium]|nr:hypothetical protein [Myxococcales bacterium]
MSDPEDGDALLEALLDAGRAELPSAAEVEAMAARILPTLPGGGGLGGGAGGGAGGGPLAGPLPPAPSGAALKAAGIGSAAGAATKLGSGLLLAGALLAGAFAL